MAQCNYLYLLSEDDNDDIFYKACLEKIHTCEYEVVPTRLRKGGGIGQVRQALTLFLNSIKNTGYVDSTFFLVSVDNDRRIPHADHINQADFQRSDFNQLSKTERRDQRCRHCELEQRIGEKLGVDRDGWPIPGAIAVPVEMLESWLLLICRGDRYASEAQLPVFSEKTKSSAQTYYGGPQKVPDQLKDLVEAERQVLDQSKRDFYLHCAQQLDPPKLAAVSPSFAEFLKQLDAWHRT
jgi:hypothetical protein